MANLDIFEREGLNAHVKENAPAFRHTLERLLDLPIVGDVRGAGYFYGIELVRDKTTRETFNDDEAERLLRGIVQRDFTTTPFIVAAAFYLAMTLLLTWGFARLENRYARQDA